jgi:hypothetical protein
MRSEMVETEFEAKPGGGRKVRRTKLIWMEDVENDLRGLKVKRWREMSCSIKEVKVLDAHRGKE